jgi:hypothetical protein
MYLDSAYPPNDYPYRVSKNVFRGRAAPAIAFNGFRACPLLPVLSLPLTIQYSHMLLPFFAAVLAWQCLGVLRLKVHLKNPL